MLLRVFKAIVRGIDWLIYRGETKEEKKERTSELLDEDPPSKSRGIL